ncbi:MAG TPA: hypothetical protein ENN23_06900 [Deltaproteobacteria bacterium]|nr:hypothetical protein [Deltaproteobacteria bacterium]
MKRFITIILVIFLVASFTLLGCKKKEEAAPAPEVPVAGEVDDDLPSVDDDLVPWTPPEEE